MNRLYLVRHGIAVPHGDPNFAEDDRPLTDEGEAHVRDVAKGLRRLGVKADRILTSPLPRAARTAELIAAGLGLSDVLEPDDALRADRSAESIRAWLKGRPEPRLMIVGHNPSLHELAQMLIASGDIDARERLREKLPTSGLVIIDFPLDDWAKLHPQCGRLERFVTGLRAGVVVVSHDREFLARTVTRVLELDLHQHQVNLYGGGYDAYLREREVARQHAREAYEEYADKLGGLRDRMTTQRNWATQGVRNARRKQATERDKFVKNFAADSAEKQAAKVRQSEKAIERLQRDAVEEPRKEWELRMEITAAPRSGAVTAALSSAVVRRGDWALGPVDLEIGWAEKVAITGPNGAGKTTLLGALLGRIPLDEGSAYLGPGVVVGEVDQARGLFEERSESDRGRSEEGSESDRGRSEERSKSDRGRSESDRGRSEPDHGRSEERGAGGVALVDAFAAQVPDLVPEEIRTLLAKYGLKADHVTRPAASLSPGERTRAVLALLQARGVNLLVLDEPTNHLDLPAIEQLEKALDTYPGTLLLVTHDRRMLTAVHTTRQLRVADGRVSEV